MIFKAILSNKAHPELGQATIPLPIRDSEYDHTIGLLEGMDIGSLTAQDCRVDGLDSSYPILDRLVTQTVNVDELDYLAKRLDSFCQSEVEKFQAMAVKLGLSNIQDFINLTFCCQQTTVITDFSNLERIGKGHALTMNGGSMPSEEYDQVDGRMVALDLLQNHSGTITPYGVVYDNGMKLEAVVLVAKPQYASEVCQLAENLDQFDFMPRPFDSNADCAITELGYVAYHGCLTLEELMRDDPAEQYQREMREIM